MKTSIGKSNLIEYDSYKDWQSQSSLSLSNVLFLLLVWAVAFQKNFEKKENNIASRIEQTKVANTGVKCSHRVGTKTKLTTNCA